MQGAFDLLKAAVGVISAVAPFFGADFFSSVLFKSLNPRIVEETRGYVILTSVVMGCVGYGFTYLQRAERKPAWPGVLGGFIFSTALVCIVLLVNDIAPIGAAAASTAVRLSLISLFGGAAIIVAWLFGLLLNDPAD